MNNNNEDSLRNFWDNIKHNSILIIEVPEEDERKRHEKVFEIIVKIFPKMGKEITTHIQKVQGIPYRINPRRNIPRYILIKLQNSAQGTNIKISKGKVTNNIQGIPLQARREWQDILKVMKGEILQPRLLYLTMILFRFEGEIKSFTDK